MKVTVNGEGADVDDGTTVSALAAGRAEEHRRVAVAVNSGVVPRSAWGTTVL